MTDWNQLLNELKAQEGTEAIRNLRSAVNLLEEEKTSHSFSVLITEALKAYKAAYPSKDVDYLYEQCLKRLQEPGGDSPQVLKPQTIKKREIYFEYGKWMFFGVVIPVLSYSDPKYPELLEALEDFVRMRKMMRKVITRRAAKGIMKRLGTHGNGDVKRSIAVIDQAIEKSHDTFYPLKMENDIHKNPVRNAHVQAEELQGRGDTFDFK